MGWHRTSGSNRQETGMIRMMAAMAASASCTEHLEMMLGEAMGMLPQ